jgi:Penicillin-insensitive murein endopeptidase/Succinylglutamate desuccinylase / Aspartoacylase family
VLRRLAVAAAILGLAAAGASASVDWHRSRSVGLPYAGRLVHGVQFPARGESFETWDPALKRSPNRGWRRWGSDRLVAIVLRVVREYRRAHPWARPVLVGDLSRPHGGNFGRQFGALGHASHQNGLDVDVYYPRRDGYLRPPTRPRQIDHALAQDLLDRFLHAGATTIFVGPHTNLRGPRKIVVPLVHHDNHMHVRIAKKNRKVVYGRSVEGRPIRALELGFPGTRRVLVVSCIHGNECAGTAVVRRLEALPPPLFDLWVVPVLNPDGRAARTRENAGGVDLNRDFQGPGRLSEPESRFAARLIRRLHPRVTIWFHQHENRVRAWGHSVPAARRYARAAGMSFAAVRRPAGSATSWQNERFPGTSSFVVELPAGRLSSAAVARHVRAILRAGE